MKATNSTFRRLGITVGAGVMAAAVFGVVSVENVAAQTSGGQSGYGYRGQQRGNGSGTNTSSGTPLSSVVAQMSSTSGVQILADRAVANYRVTAPTTGTTSENVDEQVKALVAQLPSGSVSGKFYLPVSSKSTYTADSVEEFAMAEAQLFGPVGGPQTTGTIEILGQKVASDKAATVVSALNLKPVYLIGNPSSGGNSNGPNGGLNSANGGSNASQQAQQLLNMSASERGQALTQMMSQNQQNQQVIGQVMQSVTPAERQQLMQSLRGSMGGGMGGGFGGGGRGGFGGGPGGPGGSGGQ